MFSCSEEGTFQFLRSSWEGVTSRRQQAWLVWGGEIPVNLEIAKLIYLSCYNLIVGMLIANALAADTNTMQVLLLFHEKEINERKCECGHCKRVEITMKLACAK